MIAVMGAYFFGILCGGLFVPMIIGEKECPKPDLRNQIISLRIKQSVIDGQFESIQKLYDNLRARTEIMETKNEKIGQAIESIRRAGQAGTE